MNAARHAQRLKLLILTAVAVVIVIIWVLAAESITSARRVAIYDAKTDATNLSAAFAEENNFIMRNIEGAMSVVARQIVEHRDNFNLYDMSTEINQMSDVTLYATLIDAHGWLQSTTQEPHPAPLDLNDRDHYRVPANPSFKGTFISKPIASRVSGQVTIQLSRRIESEDGRFLGVLVFAVRPSALTSLHESINIGQHDFIALYGLDDVVRARFSASSPDGLQGIGDTISNHPTPAEAVVKGDSIVIRQTKTNNSMHIISFRRVRDYPLVVGVAFDLEDKLVDVNEHSRMTLITGGIATLLLGALVIYLMHEINCRTANEIALVEEHQKLEDANSSLAVSKEQAERAENLLTDAIECVSDAFIIYDKDDRLVLCNEAYRRLYPNTVQYMQPGISHEELLLLGLKNSENKVPTGREAEWLAERRNAHQQLSGASHKTLSDGRHLKTTERRMKFGGTAGLRIDVTNLVQTQKALEMALIKAEGANQAKALFLANMSHELRTPLNAIIGFSQLIKDQTLGPGAVAAYAEYAKDIHDAGDHLLEIINNMLDSSRIEMGKFNFKEETAEIGELVHSAVQMVHVQAAKKSIVIEEHLSEEPVGLHADPLRLRQVLINLLANAVKFTPKGGRVTVSFEASPAAVFTVTDTGIGMSPEEIAVATEPFRQIENDLTKSHDGVGLGLSLAKHMTEMHGGTLEIESQKGLGTTVRVILPAGRILHTAKSSAAA